MSDDGSVTGGITEDFAGGIVSVTVEPAEDAKVRLTARYNGETVECSEYSRNVFTDRTQKGTFCNAVENQLEPKSGIDAADIKQEVREWMGEMGEMGEEEQEAMLPGDIRQILDGTQYPVRVYGGEESTWEVSLTFNGVTNDLEFSTGEMASNGGGALREKILNKYYELVDINEEDWQIIRERWMNNKEVVYVNDESAADAIATRVIEHIRANLVPVGERDRLPSDVATVWYDEGNSTGYPDADIDEDIAWVQDSFIVDQLKNAGKQTEYKGQLTKTMIRRGDMLGPSKSKAWASESGSSSKMYPFEPQVLDIDGEDLQGTSSVHSEVEA